MMKKISIIKNTSSFSGTNPLINIVTRTSGRENFFDLNHSSVVNQTYKNVKHYVIYDDKADYEKYLALRSDIVPVYVNKEEISKQNDIADPRTGPRFLPNLYFNQVFNQINDGWILILDDDDSLKDEHSIANMVNRLKYNDDMLIFQMEYMNGNKLPDEKIFFKKPVIGRIGSPCVLVHNSIAKKHKWDGWKCADYRYISKCWDLSNRKKWFAQSLISIGSKIGNFGRKNDIAKKKHYDLIFAIPTYNRTAFLKNILEELSTNNDISWKAIVIDDNSLSHKENKELCSKYKNVEYKKNAINNGKQRYWETFNAFLNIASNYTFNHLVQIDDDFELCSGFSNYIHEISLKNQNIFFKYIVDSSSNESKRWGMANWIDGGTMIPYSFLKRIRFRIDPIPRTRWAIEKTLSSGVWQQMSQKLNRFGYSCKHSDISYALHLGNEDSKMNPSQRKKHQINTINYIEWNK